MMTFRKLMEKNTHIVKAANQQSPLDKWFEHVVDIPIEKLAIKDLCRAIRQDLYVDELMPIVLNVMTYDPLAGEYYDGELIAALSTIKRESLEENKDTFIQIQGIINQLPHSEINDDLKKDILKINEIL